MKLSLTAREKSKSKYAAFIAAITTKNNRSLVFLIGLVSFINISADTLDYSDSIIIPLILHREYKDSGYTIVDSITTLSTLSKDIYGDRTKTKLFLKTYFSSKNSTDQVSINGVTFDQLYDKLINKNNKPVKLTIRSSPENGYIVNYKGNFAKYFTENGGGWASFHKENPRAHGFTEISLPVCDKLSGLILIYMGNQYGGLSGSGSLYLYKYVNNKLECLGLCILWKS